MSENKPRINSAQVASMMLDLERPVSGPELTLMLARKYPDLRVEKNDVYVRIKGFSESRQAVCIVNTSVRPRTFYLRSISRYYFKFREGRRTPLDKMFFGAQEDGFDMSPARKRAQHKRRSRETRQMCREIFRELELKRRAARRKARKTPPFTVDVSLLRKRHAQNIHICPPTGGELRFANTESFTGMASTQLIPAGAAHDRYASFAHAMWQVPLNDFHSKQLTLKLSTLQHSA